MKKPFIPICGLNIMKVDVSFLALARGSFGRGIKSATTVEAERTGKPPAHPDFGS